VLCDAGMAPIDYCKKAIDLNAYVDSSKYTIFDGVHVRMSSKYFINSFTNVTVVENPGMTTLNWHHYLFITSRIIINLLNM